MSGRSFAFGRNWRDFIDHHLDQERIGEAKKSLVDFMGAHRIEGKRFLDVGCGSGLFSLAAHQLGAAEVFSLDVDRDSVKCCEHLKGRVGNPANWTVRQASILDDDFVSGAGRYDVVYSWGVLHHTGAMWTAIENASRLVADRGAFYIAIYNKADGIAIYPDGRFGPSSFWVREKKLYVSLPAFLQAVIDLFVMAFSIFFYLVTFRNPVRKIRAQKSRRGMSWRVDIKDWLGGYPYEYASVHEIFRFVRKLGFQLENVKSNNGLANNEYLFTRP